MAAVWASPDPRSVSGTDWGASLLNRALKRVGIKPRDAVVVNAMGRRSIDALRAG
jgi:hypothetical protein